MINILGRVLGGVFGIGKDFTEARKAKRLAEAEAAVIKVKSRARLEEAKAEFAMKQAEHSANWEITQAQQAANSWKDEFLTVLLYTPVLLTFATIIIAAIPGTEEIVLRMHDATDASWVQLNEAPEWYRYLLFAAASAVFGIRLTDKFKLKGKE
jgi:hypothetical protein